MAERHVVVNHLQFSYEGLFNPQELYTLIVEFYYEKGYDWFEKMNEEQVSPQGRNIRWLFEPWKSVSDYYKIQTRIRVHLSNIQDVEVEKNGKKLQLSQGIIRVTIDGWTMSDRDNQWHDTPLRWFLSVIIEKYFFAHHRGKFATWIKGDIEHLVSKMKSFLNVFEYNYGR